MPDPPREETRKGTARVVDAFLHWLGYGLCHQLPARSFFGGGHQLPVCARDTGIYFGFVISMFVLAAIDRGRHRGELPRRWVLAIGVALVGFLAWDGVTEYAGLRTTTNGLRLITGLGLGFALTLVVMPLLRSQLWRRVDPGRVLDGWREVALWLVSIPVAFAALWWGGPASGIVYPLLAAVAIIVTFSTVALISVLLVPRFERRAERVWDVWPAVLLAVGAGLGVIALAGAFKGAVFALIAGGGGR